MIQSRQPRKKQAVSASNAYNEDKKPPVRRRDRKWNTVIFYLSMLLDRKGLRDELSIRHAREKIIQLKYTYVYTHNAYIYIYKVCTCLHTYA